MQRKFCFFSLLVVMVVMGVSFVDQFNDTGFYIPAHFPKPIYDLVNNKPSEKGFLLGKKLFYDPILSADGIISCGFCHQQQAAFTHHGHDLSHGINDQLSKRNAQPLQNLAWSKHFMWDGGVPHLDLQPIVPITSPEEMGETLPSVLHKLNTHKTYPLLFKEAFGTAQINTDLLMKALSQFMIQLISADAKYDKVVRQEVGQSFSIDEQIGYEVFKTNCAICHVPPLFTNNQFATNGFEANNKEDKGRYDITLLSEDAYLFKVPSLRNVMKTAPYMHDGSFASIDQVLDHYEKKFPTVKTKRKELVAFLQTLTDSSFLQNKRFSEN